jgi:CPA1 family monovalent cation:H+ antiporter
MIEITLTTIAAYGPFAIAEHVHGSGIIATVVAGMICGNVGARSGMSPATKIAAHTFWEYVAFALNSIVFLLIGLEVRIRGLVDAWLEILVVWLAITLGRAVVTTAVSLALRRTSERLPWSWTAAMTWGGLRGALSMVLALALPQDFPSRPLIVNVTFGVVVLSIVVQGVTMTSVLKLLRIISPAGDDAHHERRAEVVAARAALRALDEMEREGTALDSVLATFRDEQRGRLEAAEAGLRALHAASDHLREDEARRVHARLLDAQKGELLQAHREGLLGGSGFEHVVAGIDAEIVALAEEHPDV